MALFQRVRSSFVDDEPEAPAAFAPEDESVGELLRRQRTEMGLDLLEVAAALKIKPAYLAAIEGGRLDQLPGAPYAVGFVRSYSDYLRLDTVEILRRFKLEAAGLDAKPDLTFPMPLGERSVPAGRIMIVAVILAICGYGGWYYISTVDRSMPERTAEVPAELVGARPESGSASKSPPAKPAENLAQTREPVAPTNAPGSTEGIVKPIETSPKADPSATPSASQAEAGPSAISPAATSSNALPATTLASTGLSAAESSTGEARPQTEAAPAAVTEDTRPAPSTIASTQPVVAPSSPPNLSAASAEADVDQPSRITLRANATSWIQVRAPDQSVLFTGFLKPGDVYRVPDRPGLSMRAGNAGGLDVLVDGKAAPALGPSGAVRNVSLNPQLLMGQDSAPN